MIPITKPFLPPKEEYTKYINQIWKRNWLTNNGPLVNRLEFELKEKLNLENLLFINNGTTALQIAINSLELIGEIITTPFSYIATTSSIVWEKCKPVFVDIDPDTFNIDPNLIEQAITDRTSAILATHVFGNPCEIEAIQNIATKNNLKIIYDGAHCFGVEYKGKSILEYGDISTLSFHATKIFHTIEGGAVISNDKALMQKMAFKRNFGHNGPEKFEEVGINGKNSEFHAAMGLCNIKYIDSILKKRKQQYQYYKMSLKKLNCKFQIIQSQTLYNYSYFPIIMRSHKQLLLTKAYLERKNIYPRRYFSPSLSKLPYVFKTNTPISDSISTRILCMPLYHTLTYEEIDLITTFLLKFK